MGNNFRNKRGINLPFFIFLFLTIWSISPVFGYHGDSIKIKSAEDTLYFADYSELLALRLYTNTKWNSLDISRDDQRLSLKPNSTTSLGVGFNYRAYGLALAIGLPKGDESNRKYGKTKRFDFQMNVYGKKIGLDGFVQIYKVYYNTNPEEFIEWTSDEAPQIPDMRVLST